MVNKYILPLPIDYLKTSVYNDKRDVNLCHLDQFLGNVTWKSSLPYKYSPYVLTPQEISFALVCENIYKGEKITNVAAQKSKIDKLYQEFNNFYSSPSTSTSPLPQVRTVRLPNQVHPEQQSYAISIDTPKLSKVKIAIANARLSDSDFKRALLGKPNRSLERYQQVSILLKEALKEHVDLLVLPESFLPLEWIPDISRLCANNQLALITGIEHVLSSSKKDKPQKVYNLTAVILPYRKENYKYAHVVYHHKVHYSPEEKREIAGYRLDPFSGSEYQLFHWRDLWFSVYCCFELASITDRALFQSYADLTVAVEWNRDISYFSNIMESLCRDLHCYCIQVNSSNYGDSRVMSPTKSALKDIIKTKGGLNYTILTGEIDIDQLRDYQRKEYELQRDDTRFKPTPPNFDPCIPEQKQNGTLLVHLQGL